MAYDKSNKTAHRQIIVQWFGTDEKFSWHFNSAYKTVWKVIKVIFAKEKKNTPPTTCKREYVLKAIHIRQYRIMWKAVSIQTKSPIISSALRFSIYPSLYLSTLARKPLSLSLSFIQKSSPFYRIAIAIVAIFICSFSDAKCVSWFFVCILPKKHHCVHERERKSNWNETKATHYIKRTIKLNERLRPQRKENERKQK